MDLGLNAVTLCRGFGCGNTGGDLLSFINSPDLKSVINVNQCYYPCFTDEARTMLRAREGLEAMFYFLLG